MSQYKVRKLNKPINCVLEVPGSKSITNRALLMAALSDGECRLNGVLFSDDSRHFLSSLIALGYVIQVNEVDKYAIIEGHGGNIPKKEGVINVGSAGTAARFMTVFLAVAGGDYTLQSSEQMKKRPMSELLDSLTAKGVEIKCLEEEGHFPFEIHSKGIKSGNIKIDTTTSSQYASALLMASVMNGMNVELTGSRVDGAYIKITTNMLKQFDIDFDREGNTYIIKKQSYICNVYNVEPDMSAACYFYAMAAILGVKSIVKGIHKDSMQGDIKFIYALERIGCVITDKPEGLEVDGTSAVGYEGIDIDMSDFSDQALTMAVVAAFGKTETRIRNIGHIRGQESDRVQVIVNELNRMGCDAKIVEEGGSTDVIITPGKLHGAEIETYDDHRVEKRVALEPLTVDGIVINKDKVLNY